MWPGTLTAAVLGGGVKKIRGACWPARLDRLVSQGPVRDSVSKQTRQNGVGVRGGGLKKTTHIDLWLQVHTCTYTCMHVLMYTHTTRTKGLEEEELSSLKQ